MPSEARAAAERYRGMPDGHFSRCFVCGPAREDAFGVFAGTVEGRELVASPWTPPEDVGPELVWAALDCPSGWAVDDFQREGVLLGRMATAIDRLPTPGEPHVVIGWRVGAEGRKRFAGSALLTTDGEVLARSRSTWIVPMGTDPAQGA